MGRYAYFQGKFVPFEEANISVMTVAFNYGTACFEGIRGYWNEDKDEVDFFRLQDHYRRLLNSCKILRIRLPYTADDLCRLTAELTERNGDRCDVYVRPIAYKSALKIGPELVGDDNEFTMFSVPFGKYIATDTAIRCATSSWRRAPDTVIPARAKVNGLYINSALARTEVMENGYDEAIMLTQDGHVAEGSTENIFVVRDGALVTPAVSDNILVGITRHTVITLAREELGLEVTERQVDRSELYIADEVFFTGTGAEIAPIREIDNRRVGDGKIGPITAKLQQVYFDATHGRMAKYLDWCYPVPAARVA